ncbi:CBS domain-containing protein, partial [Kibdelosporangium lantanae]
ESTVVQGARLLAQHNIKRLPVVDDDGRLLGVVARQDLLSVFLRKDNAIQAEIVHDVFEHGLGITVNPTTAVIDVHDGVVRLRGELETRSLTRAAEALVRRVDGVVDVHNELSFVRDDTHPEPPDVPMVGSIRIPQGGHHA